MTHEAAWRAARLQAPVTFHPHTARVLEEWRRQRGDARLPARTALSPILFGPLLPQTFVLADDGPRGWRFRLAGGFVTDLLGRELRGLRFAEPWAAGDRARVEAGVRDAARRAEPQVMGCRGDSPSGRSLALELWIGPATGPLGAPDRAVGLLQPLSAVARLGGERLVALRLVEAERATGAARPRLVVDNTRRQPLV